MILIGLYDIKFIVGNSKVMVTTAGKRTKGRWEGELDIFLGRFPQEMSR